jgi:uncharacterized repeat protein (TIGR03809 family)
MTEWQTAARLARNAQKWRDLVDRRCAHFIELHKSGRWKHYYGEAQFLLLMSEAVMLADTWAGIAPRPDDNNADKNEAAASAQAEPAENPLRRTAA